AIAKAFEALDFMVLLGVDLDRTQTAELMERFIHAAAAADTAVFFFSGHGLQANEVNYLAPVDADTGDLATFINLQSVEARLQSERGVRIMFHRRLPHAAARRRPAGRGASTTPRELRARRTRSGPGRPTQRSAWHARRLCRRTGRGRRGWRSPQ